MWEFHWKHWIKYWIILCRTTAKEKSRRRADNLTRPFETAALIFRAAVSLRLHNPMTTCRDTVADRRLICRVLFSFSQYPWSAPAKKSLFPAAEQCGQKYALYHVTKQQNILYYARMALCRPGAFLSLWSRNIGSAWPEPYPRCRSPPPHSD